MAGGNLTDNQRAVAGAITQAFIANGGIPAAFAALDPAGLSIASGEISTAAVSAGFLTNDLFMAQISDPLVTEAGSNVSAAAEPSAYATTQAAARPLSSVTALAAHGATVPSAAEAATLALSAAHSADVVETALASRWKMWGAVYGAVEEIGGAAATVGSADFTGRNWGIASGFSRTFGDGHAGLALGGAGSSFELANGLGSGTAGIFNAGLYASQNFGDAYVVGALAYGWHNVKTSRIAFGDLLTGRYNAHTFSGRIEAGWRLDTPVAAITPYAAVQATSYHLPAYTEAGAGVMPIAWGSQTETAARTELGARLEHVVRLESGAIRLTGRAAWAYNAATARALSGAFAALPGQAFTVSGAAPDRHAALLDLGIEAAFDNGLAAKLSFSGEFSGNVAAYGASAKISYRW